MRAVGLLLGLYRPPFPPEVVRAVKVSNGAIQLLDLQDPLALLSGPWHVGGFTFTYQVSN